MGGEPGFRSARFLGPDVPFAERFAEIQRRLAGLPRSQRNARFVAVIAVADPKTGDNAAKADGYIVKSKRIISDTTSKQAPDAPASKNGRKKKKRNN